MHVGWVRKEEFGIRIRLSRIHPGVWIGQGWENKPEEAANYGAKATANGWRWSSKESAEAALNTLESEMGKHGFDEKDETN